MNFLQIHQNLLELKLHRKEGIQREKNFQEKM